MKEVTKRLFMELDGGEWKLRFSSIVGLDVGKSGFFTPDYLSPHNRQNRPALEGPSIERAVPRFARRILPAARPRDVGVDHRHVRVRAWGQRALLQPKDARRRGGKPGDDFRQRKPARVKELHERQGQFGLQARDAEGRVVELDLLLVIAVRRVIAAKDLDGAVGETFENSVAVARRTQRRVHLEVRVVNRPRGMRPAVHAEDALTVFGPK